MQRKVGRRHATPPPPPDTRTRTPDGRRSGSGPTSWWSWLLHLLAWGLAVPLQLLLLALAGLAILVSVTLPDIPSVERLRDVQFQEPLRVFSADGAFIGEFGVQRRRPVRFEQIPKPLIQAFLASEDGRFFEHQGIDASGIGRAALNLLTTGEKTQGGSTISMQVTRNFLLTPEKTFRRKLAEMLLTLHLETELTKDQILELYLNQIFFGHRAYGVLAAAETYYDTPTLGQLSLPQMAMLAGIPKSPSTHNPITNPQRALERRNYVLDRMLELGFITAARHAQAIRTPDNAQLHSPVPDLDAGYIAEMARLEIIAHFGESALTRGYRVTTTLDSRLQGAAQSAVRLAIRSYDRRHGYRGPERRFDLASGTPGDHAEWLASAEPLPELTPGLVTASRSDAAQVLLNNGQEIVLRHGDINWARPFINADRRGAAPRRVNQVLTAGDLIRVTPTDTGRWTLAQTPNVSAALVAMDPRDGAVRAMVGGYAFSASAFNRAVDMRRQPGSSFKPFIYAAALAKGWTPASLIRDGAVRLDRRERWNPKNFDHKEMGPIRLRTALALSRNLAAINLLQSVGLDETRAFIKDFGFTDEALPRGLSMALGTGSVSPVKMAEGFAVFANGGYHVIPYFIERIEQQDGRILFDARPSRACHDCWWQEERGEARAFALQTPSVAPRAIDPRIAYEMHSMLRDVIERGTGTRAKRLNRQDIAGKTGTTNDVRDSWFAGYQARLVTVAWMGFDDNARLGGGEEGGRAALGFWTDFMEQALAGMPVAQLEPPAGMVAVWVDRARGTETGSGNGVREWVREELRGNLLGPAPVRLATESPAPSPVRPNPVARNNAPPRVIDELF